MIAVIADDFTGAAEIAGIGMCRGLTAVVATEPGLMEAELLVLDTNTRPLDQKQAAEKVSETVSSLGGRADWIYKKTDSVFRGHVAAELVAIMRQIKASRAILVPANPSMGRRIVNGLYTIDHIPLSETVFADDPESRVQSSDVIDLMRKGSLRKIQNTGPDVEPQTGITIGNAASTEDLTVWASRVSEGVLPAGGSDFFDANLAVRGFARQKEASDGNSVTVYGRTLFLSGAVKKPAPLGFGAKEKITFEIPINGPEDLSCERRRRWIDTVLNGFDRTSQVEIRYSSVVPRSLEFSSALVQFTAELVCDLINAGTPSAFFSHLIVEGGTTASTLVRKMNWITWVPVHFTPPGTVSLKEAGSGIVLTVKPGSYPWQNEPNQS